MRASRAHRAAISASLSLTLLLGVLPVAAEGPTLPLPDSIAAVGDSITQAASSAGSLGTDAPQNSWATGTSASVNSHASRLVAAGATSLTRHNLSVSGAKMVDLPGQMLNAAAVQPDYLTVLIGGNDVCTSTEASMTDPAAFEANFRQDGGAAFATTFATADVSGDYFHRSAAGQAKLASVSWAAGYVWTAAPPPNVAPNASFTHSCTDLACTFDDTSTDADGTIVSRAWSFGGSGDPQPHTFATAGTHPVT